MAAPAPRSPGKKLDWAPPEPDCHPVSDALEMARVLLDRGANPDIRDTRFDSTPLNWAQHFEHPGDDRVPRTRTR